MDCAGQHNMKFAFGGPAWLGAIKVSLVVFGIPGLVAITVALGMRRWLELSPASFTAVFAVAFIFTVALFMLVLAFWNRRAAKRKAIP